jgi:dolichol-phosphate mannosyltransferase
MRSIGARLTPALLLAQIVLGARVLARLVRTAGGERIGAVDAAPDAAGLVAAILPTLNERPRLGPCLDGLLAQGPELCEILVSDGGSEDGTRDLVAAYRVRDPRVRLVDSGAIPDGWNGKAWGLELAARRAGPEAAWIMTIDADVRPRPSLVASLLAHAARKGLGVLSVATEQELAGPGVALVHPALLATLVYRFGIPGHATRRPEGVQANGQCLLIRRDLLERIGGFAVGRLSLCDDVTVARRLAAVGESVGFYESNGLVSTRMYESGWEAFTNWPRSLTLKDHLVGPPALLGLVEVTFVQALPLLMVLLLAVRSRQEGSAAPPVRLEATSARPTSASSLSHGEGVRGWLLVVNVGLLAMRLGTLVGIARAYHPLPPTFWLSPLLDLPATVQLWRCALTRRHRWRGRLVVSGGTS